MEKLRLERGCMIRRADASGCMHRMGKRYFGISKFFVYDNFAAHAVRMRNPAEGLF